MPTSIKQALKKWEEATGRKAADSKEIKLVGVSPPIEKMEGPFHLLVNLEKLSLSTNMIQNIQNLQSFKSIKILSLGRNVLKSLQGVEAASETLEQLWISYNQIDKLKPLRNLVKLKVYIRQITFPIVKYIWYLVHVVPPLVPVNCLAAKFGSRGIKS